MGILNRQVENETSKGLATIVQYLASIDSSAFILAKASIVDNSRTTKSIDVKFDILVMQLAQHVNR